jgi:hypothetical protein
MEDTMIRTTFLAALLLAATAIPSVAEGPVKSAVKGTAEGAKEIGQGVVQGAGQAGKGVARGAVGVAQGTGTAVKKTGKGVWCIVTLGYGC